MGTHRLPRLGMSIMSVLVLASGSFAAFSAQDTIDHAQEYTACLNLAQQDPERAAASAVYWKSLGGDLGAMHCQGVALMAMRDYAGAASVFSALSDQERLPVMDRSRFITQASQLFLKAGQSIKARDAINQAIAWDGEDLNAFVLRARIAAAIGDSLSALKDLDYVLLEDPNQVEALIYRASLYRSLKRYDLARESIVRAQNLNPDHPYMLLERGILAATQNDPITARQAWQSILSTHPNSAAAAAAQKNLSKLRG
ncbi:MAG: tetratricopeptide repeat protein [Alphaproteobacteria bacterium]